MCLKTPLDNILNYGLYFFSAFTTSLRTDSHVAKSQKGIERVRSVGQMSQLGAQRLSERMYI